MNASVRTSSGLEVELTISRYDELTPKSAIAAANIAFGPAAHCDVCDEKRQYRVTGQGDKRRARKVN